MDKINLNTIAQEPIQGHSSKGDQPKWHLDGKWYKADHMGYEALSEVLVSRLLMKSNVTEFVTYTPVLICHQEKEAAGCVSESFQGKDEMLIPLERLHRAYKGRGLAEVLSGFSESQERIRYTVDFVESTTGLRDVGPYLTMILELDALFLNEDRHTNNLAILRNENTLEFRLCPVFDNGLALLSDMNDYPENKDVYNYISRVQAKPFDREFLTQVDAAEELYGIQLKLSFSRNDVAEELKVLSELYGNKICHRVESILLEQMRKYAYLFR